MSNDSLLTEFVADNQQAYQREAEMAIELGKLIGLTDELETYRQNLVLRILGQAPIGFGLWQVASDLRLMASAIREQALVVDAIRSRPFFDETTH